MASTKSANRRRVLVVDDEPAVTDWLKVVIEQDGRYEVRAAADGARAVDEFRAWRPEVVLLDLVLPDLDGIAKHATALSRYAHRVS